MYSDLSKMIPRLSGTEGALRRYLVLLKDMIHDESIWDPENYFLKVKNDAQASISKWPMPYPLG